MSIISRALDKMKQKSLDEPEYDLLDNANEHRFDNAEFAAEIRSKIDRVGVDIRLDQVLVEGHGAYDFIISDIDYVLNDESEHITGLPPRPNVLDINPVKKFSYPVDMDLNQLHLKGFITPHNADTHLSNTFRMIKRPLLNNAAGKGASQVKNPNVIMVTSSTSGEGKTYSAINLAISIAMEKDRRVLLIDADVNKPSHQKEFGLDQGQNGLMDLLRGAVDDMSEVIYRTNIPSLSLMFAGQLTSHATELLASDAMGRFVDEISLRYPDRVIIVDSPPLLMTTESSVLASLMGQIVLVVEAETTQKTSVNSCLDLLQNEIVLLLLNKMREKNEANQYGYYGYGHQS